MVYPLWKDTRGCKVFVAGWRGASTLRPDCGNGKYVEHVSRGETEFEEEGGLPSFLGCVIYFPPLKIEGNISHCSPAPPSSPHQAKEAALPRSCTADLPSSLTCVRLS